MAQVADTDLVTHNIGVLELAEDIDLAHEHTLLLLAHPPVPNLLPHKHLTIFTGQVRTEVQQMDYIQWLLCTDAEKSVASYDRTS